MCAMRIYMIDDNWNKQEWALLVCDKLNEFSGNDNLGISFELGFGDNPKVASQKKSQNADDIFAALKDDQGIYLIDLGLNEDAAQAASFFSLLRDSNNSTFQKAAEEFQLLKSEESDFGHVLRRYQLATQILMASRGKLTMLVSTDTPSGDVAVVKKANLASVAHEGFPAGSPKKKEGTERFEIAGKWARRILRLLNPLDLLIRKTKAWFSLEVDNGWRSARTDGLPHTACWTKFPLDDHKKCVKSILHWCPEAWWSNQNQALAFHESLKCTLGNNAQWMSENGDRPLSLGGAYLMFLIAMANLFPDRIEDFFVPDWCLFSPISDNYAQPLPFMPSQNRYDAEQSVRALYALFCAVLPLKLDQGKLAISQSLRYPDPHGRRFSFSIKLDWTKYDLKTCGRETTKIVREGLEEGESIFLNRSKTTGAFLRFLLRTSVRKSGLGSIGTISIDESGWMKVGK